MSVRSASARLQRTARSQLDDLTGSGEELALRVRGSGEAISQALELRRWAGAGSARGGEPPAIGVAADGDDPENVFSRASALASAAEPGRILVGPHLASRGDVPPWLALRKHHPARELGGFQTEWHGEGPGASPLPVPGAIAASIDRPWPLLGRRRELDEIAANWHRVVGGGRCVHLVAGEMGSGKTRLVAEASAEVHRAGGLVLHGTGGGAEDAPYGLFIEALTHLSTYGADVLPSGFQSSPFAGLMPGSGASIGAVRAGELGDERAALFGAAAADLGAISTRTPVLLVVDDLHACGLSSLRLLDHLARTSAPPLRIMILATYRPTDVEPTEERAVAIARLRGAPAGSHVELNGLSRKAIGGIAAAIGLSGDDATLDAAASSASRTAGGNPLFASEILLSMREAGAATLADGPLPRSLRILIAGRAHGLGERVYRHLCAASVAGRRFDPAIVAEALDVPAAELAKSMATGERSGLVSTVPDGRFLSFTHEATADSLYEETRPATRGQLHRRLAEVLELRSPDAAAQLALHWRRADPPDVGRAMRFSGVAGKQALERGDHEGAVAWFERALELYPSVPGAGEPERCDLLIDLGTALCFSGEARFRDVLLKAARLSIELDDTDRLVSAALANNRGFNSVVGEFDRERVSILELAAERLTSRSDPRKALVLAQLALELTFSPQLERRRELAAEALEIAREGGDQRVLARVLIHCVIARWGPDNADERVAQAGRAAAISAALDEQLDLFHGLFWQAAARVELGHLSEAGGALVEQRRIAARNGDRTAGWLCECGTSLHAALHGNLGEADRAVHAALELALESAQPDALPFFVSQLSSIRWQQGRLHELASTLASALEQNPGLPSFRSLVCLANVLSGEHRLARDVLAIDVAGDFGELPVDPTWSAAIVTYAHAICELGDRDAAAAIQRVLLPHSGLLACTSISAWGLVDHALGRLSLVLGEREEGERLLAGAARGYARIAAPVWRAQAELDLLRGLRAGGFALDRERSATTLAECARIGRQHGAELLIVAAPEEMLSGAGTVPGKVDLEGRVAALGLTDRQAEVVTLVAKGHANAEIATELGISQSTVKRHLENISTRLGVHGRGALAAMLLRGSVIALTASIAGDALLQL